jgi:hypothetical protein
VAVSQRCDAFLQEITSFCTQDMLTSENESIIKDVFMKILESGETYSMDDIEKWLSIHFNSSQNLSERILNISHYQKAKYEATNRLKMAPDSCGCGGNC